MQLHVFFTPADLLAVSARSDDVYIVVDVIRATTTVAVMFDQGAKRVYAANTLEQARLAAQRYPERLLCGERHALPPPGFDYGNSPTQFAHIDLGERELILTTTNGSRAFFACPEGSMRLAGSFYNASAVTACALRYAQERSGNIAIVCAGEGGYFALDDTACAGFLAREIQRQHAAIEPHESVLAAQAIYEAYPPARILEYGNSARSVIKAGLRADLDFCIQTSATSTVPLVEGKEAGTDLLVIRQV